MYNISKTNTSYNITTAVDLIIEIEKIYLLNIYFIFTFNFFNEKKIEIGKF